MNKPFLSALQVCVLIWPSFAAIAADVPLEIQNAVVLDRQEVVTPAGTTIYERIVPPALPKMAGSLGLVKSDSIESTPAPEVTRVRYWKAPGIIRLNAGKSGSLYQAGKSPVFFFQAHGARDRIYFFEHSQDGQSWNFLPIMELGRGEKMALGFWCEQGAMAVRLQSSPSPSGDPELADSDGDSISNLAELKAGLSPLAFDSDGDGVGDGAEVAAHTNPLDPASQSTPSKNGEGSMKIQINARSGWGTDKLLIHTPLE